MDQLSDEQPVAPPPRRWRPLGAVDRRVAGVLAEKAKTTPDIYPMSLHAVCTACNQKSNRSPLMQIEPDQAEESLDRLRELGAVGLVEGFGRVQKYRHYLYEWLGVDKVELAVMTELLLRGDQTVGELRGRASRMEPIADMAALRPVLDSLLSKGLVVALTPEGRGQAVSHALYQPRELESLCERYRGRSFQEPAAASSPLDGESRGAVHREAAPVHESEIAGLRLEIAELRQAFDELRDAQLRSAEDLLSLKASLGE
jgi:uncharacterized protein